MMVAEICTVGPSRPIDAPQARPTTVSSTLPTAMRTDSVRSTSTLLVMCKDAITCGMPLPWAPGKMVRVSSTLISRPAGVRMNGTQGGPRQDPGRRARQRPPPMRIRWLRPRREPRRPRNAPPRNELESTRGPWKPNDCPKTRRFVRITFLTSSRIRPIVQPNRRGTISCSQPPCPPVPPMPPIRR